MADKEEIKPGKRVKQPFIIVRRLAVMLIVLIALSALIFPQVTYTFNYLSNRWGDFQYHGGWYNFDKGQSDSVWYVQTGFFQKDVVVPATVQYKGRTYQVEGVSSRVTVYEKPQKNVSGVDAKGFLLRSFIISEGVTSLPHGILMYSDSVEYVEIPGTCKILGSGSFTGCISLQEVVLGEGIEVIERDAFCAAGKSGEALKVNIPDSVQYIGAGAFSSVELERLKLPANLIEIEVSAFKEAFWRENPSKCTIPPKVTRIGADGLGNTLTELIFEGTTPPDIQYDIPTVNKVTVPKGYMEIYQTAYNGKFNENVVFVEMK